MKILRNLLWTILWSFVGVFIGSSIFKCYHYITHLDLYMIHSAPWYLSIEVNAVFTAIIVVVCLIAIWLIKKKMSSAAE